ncbi:MAG TPA: hypothetical protein VKE74_28890, partial [Gemmataceae bacterium]|nr:hypothetical protein [Gemmataceae bacterium]
MPHARATIIDSWQTPQQLATPPQMVEQVVSGPAMIGGFRGSNILAGAATSVSSLSIENGTLTFAVDASGSNDVFLFVTWNGRPPGVGLGGVDVTEGGRARGFSLDVLQADGDIRYALVVADTSPRVGNVLGVIPDGARNLSLFLPFSEFIGQTQPVRIDMTRVDKVQLQLQVSPGGRIVLGPIQTPAPAVVPEPATVCLWALLGVAGASRL